MASGSKKGGWEAKGEKVQTSCRRRIWKENHKMQKGSWFCSCLAYGQPCSVASSGGSPTPGVSARSPCD
ncbi:hypothetical protein E2562_009637 [Oryza meyeriana var. granulata]|uniref:Uncharacterized protein n=1 Tax=Oryza meyeriana var. granulata TaxID=110450 RepID=A0A6G1D1K2_9ORYZ|nr:hypothetical protein E2562_009637 [Oryza meyeriana var. granulata]